MNDFWMSLVVGNTTRVMAFWLVIGTLIGSVMPEFGNLATPWLKIDCPHYFNQWFLVIGILGILGFGLTLFFRCVRRI